MLKHLSKTKYFLLCFIIIEAITILGFYRGTKEREKQYFAKKINELQIANSSIVSCQNKLARIIFNEIINQPEIISIFKDACISDEASKILIREKLYKTLFSEYLNLNKNFHIYLHFQLPDCSSFLRFYRPEKFGDDLAETRYSIKVANTQKIPVHCFETGNVYQGYRFIYPLFNDSAHIGSVEIGVSFEAMKQEMEKLFDARFDFIINKNVAQKVLFTDELNNFVNTSISDDYIMRKSTYEDTSKIENKTIEKINKSVSEKIKEKFLNDNEFSFWTTSDEKDFIGTFIPILNYEKKKIAYIISYTEDATIHKYMKNFYGIIAGFSILLLAIFFIIYYVSHTLKIIKKNKNELQSVMDNMTDGLLVLDKKLKIISVNNAAEKILSLYKNQLIGRDFRNIVEYKDQTGRVIEPQNWPVFEYIFYGLPYRTYKATFGFFITKNNKEVYLDLSAVPRYQKTDLAGFLIVFNIVNPK